MAWDPPSAFSAGAVFTAAQANQIRDSLLYLHGDAGAIALSSPINGQLQDSAGLARAQVFAKQAVAGVSTVLIPDGTGDVTALLGGVVAIRSTDNVIVASASVNLLASTGGTTIVYNAGGNEFWLTLAANGQVAVIRNAGTKTYDVAAWLVWI